MAVVNPARFRQIEELYHSARKLEPGKRGAFLAEVCRGDEGLRREVESLLAQDELAGPMEQPPLEVAAKLLADSTVTELAVGARLGPYRIEAPLGAGGMGEVYRATDTRLYRKVAVKIAHEKFSDRFEREARAIAALNHPHICTLHDVGPNYLVMELVDGETLAARLKKGALSIEVVLQYGAQIADALAAAHVKGIIHRDLKPGNIMVTKTGVKVLDFGLAKTQQDATLTASRAVMGTPAYMAPEQIEGKECDARTDIYTLGLVLREMATGDREGKTLGLSPQLAHVIERCLARDPENRWQAASDVKAELEWAAKSQITGPAGKENPRWIWRIAAPVIMLGAIAGGWAVWRFLHPPADRQTVRLQIEPPEGGQFVTSGVSGIALSPNGRIAAYIAAVQGKNGLWVQPLDGPSARLLAGTEGAALPFWSPDSKSIAYFAGDWLYRIDLVGGSPIRICYVGGPRGGTWSSDGRILYAGAPTAILQVPASGGTPSPLTTLDKSRDEFVHQWPQTLPGGHFLYLARSNTPENTGVYAASLAKPGERVRLLNTDSDAEYASGADGRAYLLWSRGGTLVAQEFDSSSLKLTGEPHPVADGIASALYGHMQVAASATGLLLYASSPANQSQLTWLDRTGKSLGVAGQSGDQRGFALSPDDRRIVLTRTAAGGGFDLWLLEVERDVASRFTFDPGNNVDPLWSPDGRSIVFSRSSGGLLRKDSSSAEKEQVLIQPPVQANATSWSRDGRFIMYYSVDPNTKRDLWILPVMPQGKTSEAAKPRPYLRTPYNESFARFSPELSPRWAAYQSDESGRYEVYIRAFPEPRGKLQISKDGGQRPAWGPARGKDKGELFYVSPEDKLMAVTLKFGSDSVDASAPRELFPLLSQPGRNPQFEVSADGERFLVNVPLKQAPQPLTVIINWPALLNKAANSQ